MVSGLGICLSDLVVTTSTATGNPLPTITGIDTPTTNGTTVVHRPLQWWEILLMALGCAFIFVLVLMCWRRRARKRRAAATADFAAAKRLDHSGNWRHRLARFGERLFGHRRQGRWMLPAHPDGAPGEDIRLAKLRAAEEARFDHDRDRKFRVAEDAKHERDMDRLLESYEYTRAGSSRAPSPLPSLRSYDGDRHSHKSSDRSAPPRKASPGAAARIAEESLYSQVTGQPRRAPEPRQPVRDSPRARPDVPSSRFSASTTYSSWLLPDPQVQSSTHLPPTPAQEYARSVSRNGQLPQQQPQQPYGEQRGAYWLQPSHTGGSRNPFLQ